MVKVKCFRNVVNPNIVRVKDLVDNVITMGIFRPVEDYIDECLHGMNECAVLIDKYERALDGKDCIVWCDEETGEIFISY